MAAPTSRRSNDHMDGRPARPEDWSMTNRTSRKLPGTTQLYRAAPCVANHSFLKRSPDTSLPKSLRSRSHAAYSAGTQPSTAAGIRERHILTESPSRITCPGPRAGRNRLCHPEPRWAMAARRTRRPVSGHHDLSQQRGPRERARDTVATVSAGGTSKPLSRSSAASRRKDASRTPRLESRPADPKDESTQRPPRPTKKLT